jgi:hypothetical protein
MKISDFYPEQSHIDFGSTRWGVSKIEHINARELWTKWEKDYAALLADGEQLWRAKGFDNDIRAGWQKAAKENKLYTSGIRKDWQKTPYAPLFDGTKYIQELEEEVKTKQRQIDTLLFTLEELKKKHSPPQEEEIELF